ncbi:hypothetical protein KNP414_01529 [Paenibacillus mucilaginosus KNP414]|uniref:DUF948 domain-containing protein n=2 Tax=Paenibacillus mucilaginosus TaxID=61624 RepID=F8FML0_PAEMK|nr:hypothetical protein KNP414_01529 [Paenibacillus mucilaginosus KNP414]
MGIRPGSWPEAAEEGAGGYIPAKIRKPAIGEGSGFPAGRGSSAMWWQWGLGLCMLAFVVLAACAVRLMRDAGSSMRRTVQILEDVERQVKRSGEESERLLRASTAVVEELQQRMRAADPWLEAVAEAGTAAKRLSRSMQEAASSVERTVQEAQRALEGSRDTVGDVVELTTAGLHLWQRWQASRQAKPKECREHDSTEKR